MAISGIAAGMQTTGQQPLQSVGHHKHGGNHSTSLSDIDAQGSSVASPPSATGKIGNKINLTA
jgi:hypothetical protein